MSLTLSGTCSILSSEEITEGELECERANMSNCASLKALAGMLSLLKNSPSWLGPSFADGGVDNIDPLESTSTVLA